TCADRAITSCRIVVDSITKCDGFQLGADAANGSAAVALRDVLQRRTHLMQRIDSFLTMPVLVLTLSACETSGSAEAPVTTSVQSLSAVPEDGGPPAAPNDCTQSE